MPFSWNILSTSKNVAKALTKSETRPTVIAGIFLLLCLHGIIKFEQIREDGSFQDLNIPIEKGFIPLGIDKPEDFPSDGPYKIPRIIHQTWKTEQIPSKLIPWVKTWIGKHPDWEYMLWTDESARKLIHDKYPLLLSTYDSYTEGIRKADALRYIILYEYGGVYADMDLESLRPIDPMLRKYSCFIGKEPDEHPILDSGFDKLVINALIGCRAQHPFMKLLMNNLPAFKHMWHVMDSTGPHFVTLAYNNYTKNNKFPTNSLDGIYLAPSEYFFPTIDPSKYFWFRNQCSNFISLTLKRQKACKNLQFRGVKRKPRSFSFTDHHWIHTYVNFKISLKGPVDIHTVVPKVKIYT